MRIISGQFKSRRFNYKLPDGIRPTTDMAKETLFNILDNLLEYEDKRILDLYAGSGNIGIEFLSRGASFVQFNDKNYNSVNYIKKILSELKIDNYKLSKSNSTHILKEYGKDFDIIYVDPPYLSDEYDKIERILNDNIEDFKDKIVIVESDINRTSKWNFDLIREKTISSSNFKIYKIS